MATLPKISKENADAVSGAVTVMANGTNGLNNAGNTGSFVPNPTVSTGTDVVIGTGQLAVGAVQTADMVATLPGKENGFLATKTVRKLGWTGFGFNLAGTVKDGIDIYGNLIEKDGDWSQVKAKEVLSLLSNLTGTVSSSASIAAMGGAAATATGVGAPVGAPVAGLSTVVAVGAGSMSVGLGVAANSVDENLTIGQLLDNMGSYISDSRLGKFVSEAIDEARKSENHSPTKLLEKLLTPIMEFGINLSKEGDELSKEMEDLAEKIKDTLKDILDKIADLNLPNPFDDLPDDLAEAFAKWAGINRSGFHYFYDPIVLDLDGDGIETITHDKLKKAVFDHDGDGIAHATGWVKKDDGILVLDRNGDGVINDGREVFGDSTILSTGETAKHGYEALADLDSDGNGKINADDAKFNELRVWRDLDSDGVSDVGELFGLHELGIGALNLDYQEVDRNLAGGNKLTQLGSYEKHDGKTGVMGDVNFNFHGVYTKHLDGVKNTDDRLPNLQGSGRVRSLSEAMTLSSELRNIVVNYLNAKSKDEQLSMMDGLLKAWAKTDPDYQDYEKSIFLSIRSSSSQKGAVGIAGSGGATIIDTMGMAEFDKIKYKIGVIDSFMSTKTDNMFYANVKDFEKTTKIINDTYDKLIKSVYSGLYPQTVQNRYGDLIDIVVDVKDGNILFGLDINRLVSDFKARLDVGGQTAMSAFGDIMEYFAYLQVQTQPNIVGRDKLVNLIEHVVSSVPKHELDGWINGIDFKIDRELPIKMGDAQDNHLNGGAVFAGAGNDRLTGTKNSDLLFGQDGNDTLNSGNGDDILNGGAGDDYLSNSGHKNGNDTYIFSGDYGNDVIYEYDWNTENRHQDTIRFTDVNLSAVQVLLKGQDLILKTSDSNSVTIQNFQYGDSYHIENFEFADQTVSLAELMATKVAAYHGTDNNDNHNIAQWKSQSIAHLGAGNDVFNATGGKTEVYGQDGNDRVTTGTGNDVLDGGNGNDTLNSGAGDDLLFGQDGNDRLIGGNGDDILNGGAGDDYLQGGAGADTFVFSLDVDLVVDVSQIGFDKIADFDLKQGDKIDLTGLFADKSIIDNFGDYIHFEKSGAKNITMTIDIDGKDEMFEKIAIADIYSNNIDGVLNQLNQGEGLIL